MIRSFLPFIYPFKAVSIGASLSCVSVRFTTGSAYPGSCCVQQQQWRWQTPKQETWYSGSSPLMHLWGTTINSINVRTVCTDQCFICTVQHIFGCVVPPACLQRRCLGVEGDRQGDMSPGSLLAGDSGINLSRDTVSRTAVPGKDHSLNVAPL